LLIFRVCIQLKIEDSKIKNELKELKVLEANAMETLERHKIEQADIVKQEDKFFKEYCRHKRQLLEVEDQSLR